MNIPYGIADDIGYRSSMENEYSVFHVPKDEFFSAEIYDGHGGREASVLAAGMLTPTFLRMMKERFKKPHGGHDPDTGLIHEAYIETDRYIVKRGTKSGTTAATFYIIDEYFIAANVGDTRIIIGVDGGTRSLTVDHKPSFPEEKARIEKLGGEVIVFGVPRVQGILAVSRSLGDLPLKPFVVPDPLVHTGRLGRENDCAVLACDGVWDVLCPDETMEIARSGRNPQIAAETILNVAREKGSIDNITVIVLNLSHHTSSMGCNAMEIRGIYDTYKAVNSE